MKKRVILTASAIIVGIYIIGSAIQMGLFNMHSKPKVEDPLLEDVILLERLIVDKREDTEDKLLELASRKDAVGYYAILNLADRLADRGEDAAELYQRALELFDDKDVKYKLAQSLEKQGKYVEAAEVYASILFDSNARDAFMRLSIDVKDAGKVLIDNKQWKAARDYLSDELEKLSGDAKRAAVEKMYGRALYELGEYEKALPLLERLYAENPLDEDIALWYGRSLEEGDQPEKAKNVYKAMGDKGAYRLGILLEGQGRAKEAAAAFASSNEVNSIWRGAHLYDQLGKINEAVKIYERLAEIEGPYKDDAAFRVYVLLRRIEGKEDMQMMDIIKERPSWLVRLDINPHLEYAPEVVYDKAEFLNRVEAYERSGREQMAKVELSIGEDNASTEEMLALGDWYLEQSDFYRSARWGMKALSQRKSKRAYQLAYQRPFEEQVHRAAEEFGVDENLIWALMRQESYYRPDVLSPAGAMGLLQIMPKTGDEIASKLKTAINAKDLLNPDINIRFGTYYLSSLLKRYKGDEDKALAAYNGGPGNVNRWSRSGIGSSKQDFPTAISYYETREYVTKVRDSYYIYQEIYRDK